MLAFNIRRSRLGTREEVRVVDTLAKLHENVGETRLGTIRQVDGVKVLAQHLLVPACQRSG